MARRLVRVLLALLPVQGLTAETPVARARTIEGRLGLPPIEVRAPTVLVTGRIVRNGRPAPDHRIVISSLPEVQTASIEFGMGGSIARKPEPPTTVTGADGTYELQAAPGNNAVKVATLDGSVELPWRFVEVPHAATFRLDLSFQAPLLTGVAVDQETGLPIVGVSVQAFPRERDGAGDVGGAARSGADGRFIMELAPAEYGLVAHLKGYVTERFRVSVTDSGAETRIPFQKSRSILVPLVDEAGRRVTTGTVTARMGSGEEMRSGIGSPYSTGYPPRDGIGIPEALVEGLPNGRYTLSAQLPGLPSGFGLFGVRSDVTPGRKEAPLVLRPGGTVALHVVRLDNDLKKGVGTTIERLDGEPVFFFGAALMTEGSLIEFAAPAGRVEIRAESRDLAIMDERGDCLEGWVDVEVVSGARVEAVVRLDTPCPRPAWP